ncbi:unnamed protein product [Calypogeia fissa]
MARGPAPAPAQTQVQPAPTQPQIATAAAPGETRVNLVSIDVSESDGGSSSGWEFVDEMAAMETSQEDECYKVSTRSRDKHEKRKEKHETREEKKARKEKKKEETLRVSTDQDSDYRRDHPKLFYPKVNADVKKQLEQLQATSL